MGVETLIPASRIARRVAELGIAIRRDVGADAAIHFVAVLKGAFVFLADLVRATDGPLTCDFLGVTSYTAGTTSSGEVRVTKDLDEPLDGRDVVLVEDIIDTGLTLSYLQGLLAARNPRTLRTVGLLSKTSRRRVDVRVDYVGFDIPDAFVVGYGLDVDQRYRNLPDIAVWRR
jgi:hypoxanthine phosphoribosyltransferase